MIAIIDYEAGNICSVENALQRLGASYELTADPSKIMAADKVILPGVGNAGRAMESLRATGLADVIVRLRQPVLGICVGLQLMCRSSEEGMANGLGLFDAQVKRFPLAEGDFGEASALFSASTELPSAREQAKVPHMGWNAVGNLDSKLFKGIDGGSYFYFVHSYYAGLCPDTIATCRHGETLFSAALKWENYYGTQFHPEKSGPLGAQLLQNFLAL